MDTERIRELAARAGVRGIDPRVIVAVALVCTGILGFATWQSLAADRGGFEVITGEGADEAAGGPGTAACEPTATVLVHIAGAVAHPGIVELPEGSRVADAVEECGGLLGNAAPEAVNLARVLSDGEQVIVPTQDEVTQATTAGPATVDGASATGQAKVDLNLATAAELEALPGIGPATSEKIVTDRETNGPFGAVEDLQRVPGIGPKKFDSLKDLVMVR